MNYSIITKTYLETEFTVESTIFFLGNMKSCYLKIVNIKRVAFISGLFSNLFSERFIVSFFLISTVIFSAVANDLTLKAVVTPGAPVITKDKRIIYGLELVFNECPKEYWVYYSEQQKKLVIDFYGVHIKGKPKADFSGRGVFKNFEVVNSKTNLSLSKKTSSVLVGLEPDPGWHFKAVIVDNRIVRISAWRDISEMAKVDKKKAVWPYILLIILGASATFGIVIIINNYK